LRREGIQKQRAKHRSREREGCSRRGGKDLLGNGGNSVDLQRKKNAKSKQWGPEREKSDAKQGGANSPHENRPKSKLNVRQKKGERNES